MFLFRILHAVVRLSTSKGNAYEALPGYTREETDSIYGEMLRTLCTPVHSGTHSAGSSSK